MSLRPWSSLDWGLREVRPGAITGLVHVLWGYRTPCIIACRPHVLLRGTCNRRNRTIAKAIARFCGRAADTFSIFHVGIIVLWLLCARDRGRLRWGAVDQDDVLCGFLSHCIICLCRRGWHIFFHEYGRRVGMVPRSSLKEGKKRQMVEKGTKTPKTNPKTKHPSPQADSTIL